MTPDDFLLALEQELRLLAVPFSLADLQAFAADVWTLARWDPDPDRWAREFIDAGRASVPA